MYFWMAWFYDPLLPGIYEFEGKNSFGTPELAQAEFLEIYGSGELYTYTDMEDRCVLIEAKVFKRPS